MYDQPQPFVFLQKRSIIDIWQGSKYGSEASFFNIFTLFLFGFLNEYTEFCFSSESVQLLCPRTVACM